MRLRTLLAFLTGDKQAILELASSQWSLAVGALFVLSAGLAREYDGEDLLHEPWHLLVPFAASLASSLVLFALACTKKRAQGWPGFVSAYGSFLGLFWLTAPLAWLYAIPYERFLTPVGAVQANLLTLALVAAWRVLLMARVLVVLLDYGVYEASALVLTFGHGLLVLALAFSPFPLIEMMSGLRLSDEDMVVKGVAQNLVCVVALTGPASLFVWIGKRADSARNPLCWLAPPASWRPVPGVALVAVALGSVLVWVAVLPVTQPEQQHRHAAEKAFHEGRYADLLAEMSAHRREDYPPHWQPPPRYPRDDYTKMLDVCEAVADQPPAPWVRQLYLERLQELYGWKRSVRYSDDQELTRLAQLLLRLPEGPAILEALEPEAEALKPDPDHYNYRLRHIIKSSKTSKK